MPDFVPIVARSCGSPTIDQIAQQIVNCTVRALLREGLSLQTAARVLSGATYGFIVDGHYEFLTMAEVAVAVVPPPTARLPLHTRDH